MWSALSVTHDMCLFVCNGACDSCRQPPAQAGEKIWTLTLRQFTDLGAYEFFSELKDPASVLAVAVFMPLQAAFRGGLTKFAPGLGAGAFLDSAFTREWRAQAATTS
jgi:hypothetical protein